MKVEVLILTEEAVKKRDFKKAIDIKVNGVSKFKALDGEEEDANLSRDFSDCWNIPGLIKIAHEAGKNGEELDIEIKEVEDI